MATSTFPSVVTGVTVQTATGGALAGDGSSGNKLQVNVDGTTIDVNGSNQLFAAGVVPPVDLDGTSLAGSAKVLSIETNDTQYAIFMDDPDQASFGLLRFRNTNEQMVGAVYNPLYPKYTPDAQAFERAILAQWNISDSANPFIEIGSEWGPPQTLTSLTSSGNTATATKNGHGYRTGDVITIAGADQAPYNGDYTITVTNANVFTYTFAGSVTSPATGTITATGGKPCGLRLMAPTALDASGFQGVFQLSFASDVYGTTNNLSQYLVNGTPASPSSFIPADTPIAIGGTNYWARVSSVDTIMANIQPFAVSYGGVNIGGELDLDVLGEDGNTKYFSFATHRNVGSTDRPNVNFYDGADNKNQNVSLDAAGNGWLFTGSVTTQGGYIFPASDPMIVGAWWNNAGTLTISAAV